MSRIKFMFVFNFAAQVLELIQAYIAGTSTHLPVVDSLSFLFDLLEHCINVGGLVDLVVRLLQALTDVREHLQKTGSRLEGSYTSNICVCALSCLRRYHTYLLVVEDHLTPVFEKWVGAPPSLITHRAASAVFCSLCKLVQHVGNPADCSSVERCILAYLVELYTTSADVKEKYSTLFSGAETKVKSAIFIKMLTPTLANLAWDKRVLLEVLDNPKKSLQYDVYQFLKAKFVCSSLDLNFR